MVMVKTSPEERHARLQELIRTQPQLGERGDPAPRDAAVMRWFAQLYAIVEQRSLSDAVSLNSALGHLGSSLHNRSVTTILAVLHRAIAQVELELPANSQGAFIGVGASFDALAAIAKVMSEAQNSILLVDPYGSEKILSRFGVLANEGVKIDLLVSAGKKKASLLPAAEAWGEQYGDRRPLRIRGATGRALHDRAIVLDGRTVWNLSQSFDALAERSPGTITRSEAAIADDQLEAWSEIFDAADRLIGG